MKLKRYAEFKKLIITHRNPARSCRVRPAICRRPWLVHILYHLVLHLFVGATITDIY